MGILKSVPRELFEVEVGSKSHSKRKISLVIGYVRQNHESAAYVDIVTYALINLVSISCDEWDTINMGDKEYKISYDNTMYISHWNMNDGYEWNAFGQHKLSKGDKKIWKIKVNHNPRFEYNDHDEHDHTNFCSRIGIIEDNEICKGTFYQAGGFGDAYLYQGSNGLDYSRHKGNSSDTATQKEIIAWKENDIITMELDLIKGTLKFTINDIESDMCYIGIDINKTYTLAVRMWFDETIKICSCI